MARLPYSQGAPPSPQVSGGPMTLPGAGQAEAAAILENRKGLTGVAEQLAQAGERIRNREETVDRAHALVEYQTYGSDRYNKLRASGDLARTSAVPDFSKELDAKKAEILSSLRGRGMGGDSLAAIEARLEQTRGSFIDHAAVGGMQAQEKLVTDLAGSSISQIADRAYRDRKAPLDQLFADVGGVMNEYGGAMLPENRAKLSREAASQVGMARFNSYLDAGAFETARDVRASMTDYGTIFNPLQQEHINQRIEAQSAAWLVHQNKASQDVQNELLRARALANELGGSPEQRLANVARALKLAPEKQDEFERLSAQAMQMRNSGAIDTPAGKLVVARLDGMLHQNKPEDGSPTRQALGLEARPDGTGGLWPSLSSSDKRKTTEQLDWLKNNESMFEAIINTMENDKTLVGVPGKAREWVQSASGVAGDVSSFFPSLGVDAKKIIKDEKDKLTNDKEMPTSLKRSLLNEFDPNLPTMEVWKNSLALNLAKLRVLSGGGGMRALESAFKQARSELQLTGVMSANDVIQRYKAAMQTFADERTDLESRLYGSNKSDKPSLGTTETPADRLRRLLAGQTGAAQQ